MIHTPILVDEIITLFAPAKHDRLLDATLGTGGHTRAFLEAGGEATTAVGLDADPEAITVAREQLTSFGQRVTFINSNFAALNDAVQGGGIVDTPPVFTHILFDLGLGTHQLADEKRGFSFKSAGPLQMKYGQLENLPPAHVPALNHLTQYLGTYPNASDLIAKLSVDDLAEVLRVYGEERYAGRIAAALHGASSLTAAEAAEKVARAVPRVYARGRLHPATRTFQALRLAVNRELEQLAIALPQAIALLTAEGKIAVISFHSLEDRIVKNAFRQHPSLTVLTKKPVQAKEEEIAGNPKARSAKLRVAQKMK